MIRQILHARHFFACLLTGATGMVLYFHLPFPEANLFLQVMALRAHYAFLFLKYFYTLFLYTTSHIVLAVLLSAGYIFALKADSKIRAGELPLILAYSADEPHAALEAWSSKLKAPFAGWYGKSWRRVTAVPATTLKSPREPSIGTIRLKTTWMPMLSHSIASLPNNLFGRGKEPFWQQAYQSSTTSHLLSEALLQRR